MFIRLATDCSGVVVTHNEENVYSIRPLQGQTQSDIKKLFWQQANQPIMAQWSVGPTLNLKVEGLNTKWLKT